MQLHADTIDPLDHFIIISEAKDKNADRTEGGLYKPHTAAEEVVPFRHVTVLKTGPGWRQEDGTYLDTRVKVGEVVLTMPGDGVQIYEDDDATQFMLPADRVIGRVINPD